MRVIGGLLLVLFFLTGPASAGEGFFKSMPDVPLMPGLTEQAGGAISFDQPGGRIENAAATGVSSAAEIRDFYRRTLPQLGWRPAGGDAYSRDGERLTLMIGAGAGRTILQVAIEPRPRS